MEICLGRSEITEGRAADDQFQWRIQWKQLLVCSLRVNVRQDAIVCLTRSESEAVYPGKTLGAFIGGFVGGEVCVSAGVVAATLFSIPGIALPAALMIRAALSLSLRTNAQTPAASCSWDRPRATLLLRQPDPAQQVGVAGIGVQFVPKRVYHEIGHAR